MTLSKELRDTAGCYCVCHSEFSSCAWCVHCNGINEVTFSHLRTALDEKTAEVDVLRAREARLRALADKWEAGVPGNFTFRISHEIRAILDGTTP